MSPCVESTEHSRDVAATVAFVRLLSRSSLGDDEAIRDRLVGRREIQSRATRERRTSPVPPRSRVARVRNARIMASMAPR